MRSTPVPTSKAVRDVFADLLGREVEVVPGAPVVPGVRTLASVATYVDDRTRTAAVAVADLPLSSYAGAALGLVPVGAATEAIEGGELPVSLQENFAEVLNILSSLFNAEGAPHLKLYATQHPGQLPPPDVSVLAKSLGRRLDLAVDVLGYGAGRISIVVAP